MAAQDPDEIIGQVAGLGEVARRPMSVGHGFYGRETIFGHLFLDRLRLKVEGRSQGEIASRSMGKFRPKDQQTLKSYYEEPPDVLADPEELLSRVKEAIGAGQASC